MKKRPLKRKLSMIVIAVLAVIIIGVVVTLNFVPARLEKSMNKVQEHPPYDISPAALKMHDGLTIMDWHSDSLLWKRNLLERADYGHVDIPRLIEGNVAIQMSRSDASAVVSRCGHISARSSF